MTITRRVWFGLLDQTLRATGDLEIITGDGGVPRLVSQHAPLVVPPKWPWHHRGRGLRVES